MELHWERFSDTFETEKSAKNITFPYAEYCHHYVSGHHLLAQLRIY